MVEKRNEGGADGGRANRGTRGRRNDDGERGRRKKVITGSNKYIKYKSKLK